MSQTSHRDSPPTTSVDALPLHLISSMATRALLAELTSPAALPSGMAVALESVGGVDAARRIEAGERLDAVVLASDAIDRLVAAGHLLAGHRVDLAHSDVSVAVRAGAARPDISSEDALRDAVLGAASIGFSTGPSGVQLNRLFARWGIAERIAGRTVQAPAGVPVGSLVASGAVELGFQQTSELMNLSGIDVLGPLPAAVHIVTTFSGAIAAASTRPDDAAALLRHLASPTSAALKRRHGMTPA